jgi:hemolysin III
MNKKSFFKDPWSAKTHLTGLVLAVLGTPHIISKASPYGRTAVISVVVFMAGMMLLYMASTVYHTFDISEKGNKTLKRIDHLMVFVLIAASYTPFCLRVMEPRFGRILLTAVWTVAIVGMIIKFFWIYCPKWFSSLIYIGMGWLCVFAIPQLYRGMTHTAFLMLLAGGLLYSAGGVIYAFKSEEFNRRHPDFGTHEIFHVFVMAGTLCQYIAACLIF